MTFIGWAPYLKRGEVHGGFRRMLSCLGEERHTKVFKASLHVL